jgi:hypothetical protein
MGAVETLIVWENLKINRYVVKNSATCEIIIKHLLGFVVLSRPCLRSSPTKKRAISLLSNLIFHLQHASNIYISSLPTTKNWNY